MTLLIAAAESKSLKLLLSFAVGGLLGDVFLHLLPEAWNNDFALREENGDYDFIELSICIIYI